ncbi:MAG: FAD:protein FMN transferase [Clostridiales bacterium]|jgi:thiamine biosynthesis lipoprotein|nr:FAD:protein FMN transferase [Clostridiales bacterium]
MNISLRRILSLNLLLITLLTFLVGCATGNTREHNRDLFALDTVITLRVFGGRSAGKALDKAAERIREIEDHMSATLEDSDVSRINRAAGKEPVKVHEDTLFVIKRALNYGELTGGVFDITIGPIVNLWDIKSEKASIPDEDQIEDKLALVDYRKVRIDEENMTVFLEEEGMAVDLGAIAKGYAADEATRILREAGVKSALLNLGGNVITIGGKPDGSPWRVGLQDPRSQETGQNHFAIVEVKGATVVSSGDYERYMVDIYERTGERYHHIFDPRTGYPAQSGLMVSTIISASSMDADALSTILFIMGHEDGFKAIEELGNFEAIAVSLDKDVYITEGLKDGLIPSNDLYNIIEPEAGRK